DGERLHRPVCDDHGITAAIFDSCRHIGYRELDDSVAGDYLQLGWSRDPKFCAKRLRHDQTAHGVHGNLHAKRLPIGLCRRTSSVSIITIKRTPATMSESSQI